MEINITKGFKAIIDDSDFDLVSKYRWYYSNGYAKTDIGGRKNKKRIYMHRLIMGNPIKKEVDHINNERLDNRKSNLRVVTKLQNSFNSRPKGGTSKFKGVSWHTMAGKWMAQIQFNGKNIYLGLYGDENKAALVYQNIAKELQGQYAFKPKVEPIGVLF